MTVALVGNPNTGKSTLFNALTGYRQRVGNFPGTTVEKRTGLLRGDGDLPAVELVDLPGAYSLAARAKDEAVVLDALLGRCDGAAAPDLIVVVVDASNLSRNLFFTTQLLELGGPVVVALNMIDVAEDAGVQIDVEGLSRGLGVHVIPAVATKQVGIESLRRSIIESLDAPPPERWAPRSRLREHVSCVDSFHGHASVAMPPVVRAELDGLTSSLAENGADHNSRTSRVEILQVLLDPGGYHENRLIKHYGGALLEELAERRRRIGEAGQSVVEVEARARYAWINEVVDRVTTSVYPSRRRTSGAVDRMLTHRVFGLVVFLLLMGFCFQGVYSWATPLMDAIGWAMNAIGGLLVAAIPAGALQSLLVNGVVGGVGAVLTFLPQILILFLFIAILEDCGYMARAAFLLDRWMGFLGLNGKSFVPLLSSFACAIPGIMAARTIEDRRDRFVTILIAPLMSCSARLPIYTLMIGAFIPSTPLLGGLIGMKAATLLAFYFIGVAVAVPIALILKHTVLKGETQPFLMELPTYKWPSAGTVLYRVYEQGREFCVSAGTIIFAVTIVVWVLGYYPHSASIAADHEAQRAAARQADVDGLEDRLSEIDRSESGAYLQQSVLGHMGCLIEPIVRPLGWDWRIGTAAIASFPAREIMVATMGTIYNLGDAHDETSSGLRDKLHAATWPDGRPVFNTAVALSIMVFFALCCQCGGTLATIKRETQSWRWPLLTFCYMTTLAYLGALATYQVAIRLI